MEKRQRMLQSVAALIGHGAGTLVDLYVEILSPFASMQLISNMILTSCDLIALRVAHLEGMASSMLAPVIGRLPL